MTKTYKWRDLRVPSVGDLAIVAGRMGASEFQFRDFSRALELRHTDENATAFYKFVVNYPSGCPEKREEYALYFLNGVAENKILYGEGIFCQDGGVAEVLESAVSEFNYPGYTFIERIDGSIKVIGPFDEDIPVVKGNYIFSHSESDWHAILSVPVDQEIDNV